MSIDPDDEITVQIPYKTVEDEYFEAKAEREIFACDRPTLDMRPLGLDLDFDLSDGVPTEVVYDERTEPRVLVGAS